MNQTWLKCRRTFTATTKELKSSVDAHPSLGVMWVWGHVWVFMWPTHLSITHVPTRVFIMWAREEGTLNPPPPKFSISVVVCGIGRLKASSNNCCEVQIGPVWFLYWHQSLFQISDWLILHPNMKPRKTCAARVEAPMWKCLAKAFS